MSTIRWRYVIVRRFVVRSYAVRSFRNSSIRVTNTLILTHIIYRAHPYYTYDLYERGATFKDRSRIVRIHRTSGAEQGMGTERRRSSIKRLIIIVYLHCVTSRGEDVYWISTKALFNNTAPMRVHIWERETKQKHRDYVRIINASSYIRMYMRVFRV